MIRRAAIVALATSIVSVLPDPAVAEFRKATDSFDYPGTSLHYKRGGDGWNNTSWQDEERDLTLSGDGKSLTYPRGVLLRSEGARISSGEGKATRELGSSNSISLRDLDAGKEYFISLLVRRNEAGDATLRMNNASEQPRWAIRVQADGKASVSIFGSAKVTQEAVVPAGETVLLVSRLQVRSGSEADRAQLLVFGPEEEVPVEAPVDSASWDAAAEANTNVWQQRLELIVNAGRVDLDEVRIGTSWADVVGGR